MADKFDEVKTLNQKTMVGRGDYAVKDDVSWRNSSLTADTTSTNISLVFNRGNKTKTDPVNFGFKTINDETILGAGNIDVDVDNRWQQSTVTSGVSNNKIAVTLNRGDDTTTSSSGPYANTLAGKELINNDKSSDIPLKTIGGQSIIGSGDIPAGDNSWKKSTLSRSTLVNPLSYTFDRGDGTKTTPTGNVYFNTIGGQAIVNSTKVADIGLKTINGQSVIGSGDIKTPIYTRQVPNHYYSENEGFYLMYKGETIIIYFNKIQDWGCTCRVGSLDAIRFNFQDGSAATGSLTSTAQDLPFNISNGGDRYNISLVVNGFKPNGATHTLNVLTYVTYARKNGSINAMTPDPDFYFEKA